MLIADLVMALVGLLVFPAVIAVNVIYQRKARGGRPGRSSCAARSARSPTSRSTARWWSRPSAGRARRPPASPRSRRSCATSTSGSAGSARRSTHPGGAAQPRRAHRAVGRGLAGAQWRHRPRRRGHRRLPPHHRVLPDPLDRLAARRVPAQRGGLPPRERGARRRGEMEYGEARAADGRDRRPARGDRRRLLLHARPAAPRRPRLHRRAGPDRCAGRRDGVRQEHPDHPADPPGRSRPRAGHDRRGRRARPGSGRAGRDRVFGAADRLPVRRHGARQRHAGRRGQ